MLKKKAKIRKRLARIVLAALLCSGGLHGLAVPSVAEAAVTITVSNITGNTATGDITVTADPAGSMFGKYDSEDGMFIVKTDAAITGIGEIKITGSGIPAFVYGSNPDSADAGSRRMTVSGADTVLGGAVTNVPPEGIEAKNNTLIVEGARITGIDYTRPAILIAGWGENGGVSGNRVTIRNATVGKEELDNGTVNGGVTFSGYATGNSVAVEGGATRIYGEVYGGVTNNGNAADNQVNISNGEIHFNPTLGSDFAKTDLVKPFTVVGGAAVNGEATGNQVNISGGIVGAEGAKDGQVVGGYASKTVSGNTVTVTGGTVVNGAYGGYSISGPATGNALHIEGGTVSGAVQLTGPNRFDVFTLAGGISEKGIAGENTVTINGGEISGEFSAVAGGYSLDNNAEKNTVTVNGGTNLQSVHGGASLHGNAENNEVFINTGAYVHSVFGGEAETGSATGNKVTVSGGQAGYSDGTLGSGGVIGGHSASGSVSSNQVIICGGTVNVSVLGGVGTASANDNTVIIRGGTFGTEDGFTAISGGIADYETANGTAGAATAAAAAANHNSVTISGNPVFKGEVAVFGGIANSKTAEEASNNTVTILTPVTVYALHGGYVENESASSTSTGNTLNIAAKNVTATGVDSFQNMNFYLPADIANGDTMLTIKGNKDEKTGEITGNKLTGVTFGVAAQTGANLAVGDTVNLVKGKQGLVMDGTLKTVSAKKLGKAEFLAMNNMSTDDQYGLSISKLDANTIIATVDSKTPMNNEERHKSPAETREAVVTLVNAGADLLAGVGMQNAADAAAAEQDGKDGAAAQGSGGYAPFAAVGLSSLRAQSGSHVDTKGIGLALGFARELKNKSGKLLVGPLMEYGYGRYDSYQDNGTQADGKSHYWGIGVIVKQTNNNGMYYEGSLRAGRTGSDYNRNDPVVGPMSYDSDAAYFGAHLGIGRVQDIGHDNTLDCYGKYFYSHTGGDTAFINGAGVTADFDGVDSHRLRVGTRLTHAVNEKNKIYGGLAYQYEFNGDARVTYSGGGNAPSPSVKGGSGMLELGWQVKPGKSPMVIDLGVTGWVGKQRGITANLQANWTF